MSTSIFEQSKDTSNPPATQIRTENHIFDNEKDFYLSLLMKHMKKLKRALCLCLFIALVDLAVCYIYPHLFQNLFNVAIILVIIIWILICSCLFCHTYVNEDIDINTYKKVVYCMYISLSISIVILSNLIYIVVWKVLLKYDYWSPFFNDKDKRHEVILSIGGFAAYAIMNVFMSFNLVNKFSQVRKTLKSVGNLQGQEYSVTYTVAANNQLGLETGRKAEIKSSTDK